MSEFPTQPTGQPPAGQPAGEEYAPPAWEPPRRFRNGAGTSALVLGVLALVLSILVITSVVGAILGIIAIILGVVGIGRANRGEAINRGSAIAGVVTGILSLVVVGFLAFTVTQKANDWRHFASRHSTAFRTFGTCIRNASSDADRAACVRQLSDQLNQQP